MKIVVIVNKNEIFNLCYYQIPEKNLIGSVANAGKNLNVTVPEKPVEVENIDECVLVLNGKTLKENIFRLERS